MSILDKQFIYNLINQPPQFLDYDEYAEYLYGNFKYILNDCESLLHLCIYNCEENMTAFSLCKYNEKYILIEIFVGTCCGCFKSDDATQFNKHINDAIDKCYITTNLNDMKQYFKRRIENEYYNDRYERYCNVLDMIN